MRAADKTHALARVANAHGQPFGPSLGESAQFGVVDYAVEHGERKKLGRFDAARVAVAHAIHGGRRDVAAAGAVVHGARLAATHAWSHIKTLGFCLFLYALSACSSIPPLDGDIIIHARTPIIAVGKWNNGKPTCAVALEFDGKTLVVWGSFGCGVVHREVVVPAYHDEGARP